MPAYNFLPRFAPLVESGEKRQTIRAVGKRRHARPGDLLQLYTGQRTAFCRKLVSPDPVCIAVHLVDIHAISPLCCEMFLDGRLLYLREVVEIAKADGFAGSTEFFNFFYDVHDMPFHGVLIKW
jgi:hypothetical protein